MDILNYDDGHLSRGSLALSPPMIRACIWGKYRRVIPLGVHRPAADGRIDRLRVWIDPRDLPEGYPDVVSIRWLAVVPWDRKGSAGWRLVARLGAREPSGGPDSAPVGPPGG